MFCFRTFMLRDTLLGSELRVYCTVYMLFYFTFLCCIDLNFCRLWCRGCVVILSFPCVTFNFCLVLGWIKSNNRVCVSVFLTINLPRLLAALYNLCLLKFNWSIGLKQLLVWVLTHVCVFNTTIETFVSLNCCSLYYINEISKRSLNGRNMLVRIFEIENNYFKT